MLRFQAPFGLALSLCFLFLVGFPMALRALALVVVNDASHPGTLRVWAPFGLAFSLFFLFLVGFAMALRALTSGCGSRCFASALRAGLLTVLPLSVWLSSGASHFRLWLWLTTLRIQESFGFGSPLCEPFLCPSACASPY
jgi:hypothetical protein